MDKEGARLTTYRFTSPSGGVFSYTVENDSEPAGGVEEMETWEAEEALRDQWKKAARKQVTCFFLFADAFLPKPTYVCHYNAACYRRAWNYTFIALRRLLS